LLACVSHPATAHAEPALPIRLESSGGCDTSAADLSERVTRARIAGIAAGIDASVSIESSEKALQVRVSTHRDGALVGSTLVTVASCAEAIDAAVVVLVLAFSAEDVPEPVSDALPRSQDPPKPESEAEPAPWPLPRTSPALDRAPDRPREAHESKLTRVSLLTGMDAGTLSGSTAYVGVGVNRAVAGLELRSVLRYGMPRTEELDEDGLSESSRSEFASVDVAGCYGFGASWRFSGCAGGEVGVVRNVEHTQSDAGLERDRDLARARAAGVLTLTLAGQGRGLRPELELGALAVAVGREEPGRWLAVRAGVGAGMQF
jgi:hypothetical protein